MALSPAARRGLEEIIERKARERGRPLTAQEQLENLERAIWTCDRCEAPIETGDNFCGKCGYQLVEDDELPPSSRTGYCTEGDRCVCGGDTAEVRAGCRNWKR